MTKEELIDAMVTSVMENFDFDKVHRTMVAEGWKWAVNGEMKIPCKYRLMKVAERILRECADFYEEKDYYSTGTGGFTAALDGCSLSLEFVLTCCTAYAGDFSPKEESNE